MKLSKRADRMQASPIRRLAPFADEARKKGIEVLHLNIGQPDIETPEYFFTTLKTFNEKVLKYGPSGGIVELRLAVVDYLKSYNIDIELDNVWITTGGSEAIIFAFMTIADYGDEFLIFEPFYTNYNGFATEAGVRLIPITLSRENGFHLPSYDTIESYVTDKTRGIIICSPNNPTGTIFTPEEMFIIQKLVKEHGLYLISDEVYREFNYMDVPPTSALSLPEIEDRVIVVDSISKRFSACGARIGYFISRNKDIMSASLKFAQARLCPPTIEQYAAVSAFKHMYKFMDSMIEEYRKRRDVLIEGLKTIPGVESYTPEGAFYAIVKLPVADSEDFIKFLLKDYSYNGKTVMLSPANGFYATKGAGRDEVRIAYVLKEDRLKEAIEILKRGLQAYK